MAKKQTKNKQNKRGWTGFIVKLGVVGIAVLAAYMFYLDAQIKRSFEGNKWVVPAQIYARPLAIAKEQEITTKEVIDELKLLGYRRVKNAQSSGQFSFSKGQLHIQRRAFHFPDGSQPLRDITLTWVGTRIGNIVDRDLGEIRSIRLEPWLVTRLVSSSREDRMLLDLNDMPPMLTKALTLVEDRDFYDHHGVAPLSIIRALMANIAAGRTVQGGSTLTQQLVKNLYLTRERSIVRKAKEALMAIIIDARYSKSEIIQAYLNEVFLAQNGDNAIHGFGLASHYFFDRPAHELNTAEIATLVAIIKGPSYYNPRRHPDRALERRNLVLRILFEANEIGRSEYERLVDTPLSLASGASLASGKHPAFMEQVRRELSEILADPNIRESGVKVFTSLDIYAQRRAEKALTSTLGSLQNNRDVPLEAAMVVSDIPSGEIRAIVGSVKTSYSGFNRALDARRQIGSLVKPAVYLTALENPGVYNLATPLQDEPITLKGREGQPWSPQNADKKFRGQVPLIEALTRSLNVPSVNLGLEVGLDSITDTLQRLGVKEPIEQVPALTLGAVTLSPLSMNQMYQTIANSGRYAPLHTVNSIMSPKNRLLWQYANFTEQRVDEAATYLLNYALYKVTVEGTAKRISQTFNGINMAGKTGTTDDYRDSWFTGFDRNNVATVWVGNDDNRPVNLTGASGALPVFVNYQKLQSPKSLSRRFPAGLGIAQFDKQSGQVMAQGCPDTLSVPAVLDVLPKGADCRRDPIAPKKTKKKRTWWDRLWGN